MAAETLNQYKSNLTPEEVDQALHNIAQLDDGIAQAKQYAEQAQGYAESINPGNFYTKEETDAAFAPTSHANAETTYGAATGSLYGHVKLADTASASGASAGVAATPKCVQDSISANAVSVTFQNGTSDYGTHLYQVGNTVIGVIELYAPDTISSNGWVTYMHINTPPAYRLNGRSPFEAGGAARDYFITTGGDLNIYVTTVDAGKTFCVPISYVVGS